MNKKLVAVILAVLVFGVIFILIKGKISGYAVSGQGCRCAVVNEGGCSSGESKKVFDDVSSCSSGCRGSCTKTVTCYEPLTGQRTSEKTYPGSCAFNSPSVDVRSSLSQTISRMGFWGWLSSLFGFREEAQLSPATKSAGSLSQIEIENTLKQNGYTIVASGEDAKLYWRSYMAKEIDKAMARQDANYIKEILSYTLDYNFEDTNRILMVLDRRDNLKLFDIAVGDRCHYNEGGYCVDNNYQCQNSKGKCKDILGCICSHVEDVV